MQGQSWPTDTLCCAGVAALPHQQALSKVECAKKNNHNFIGFTSRSHTPGAETVLLQLTRSSRWLTMVPVTRHPDLAASPRAGAGIPRKLPAGSSSHMHHAPGEKNMQRLRTGPSEEDPASRDCSTRDNGRLHCCLNIGS